VWTTLTLLFVACSFVFAQSAPERKVHDNVITSERDPKIRIELPKNATYVGADRWILYDIADCELHAFVEADAEKNVKKWYWVQFEAYVPSNQGWRTHMIPRVTRQLAVGIFFWIRGYEQETLKRGKIRTVNI
jgi:hypothetical protein